jgi:hypothetical protein
MDVRDQLQAPAALPSGQKTVGTHQMGALVGPKAGLDVLKKTKNLLSLSEIEPMPSSP